MNKLPTVKDGEVIKGKDRKGKGLHRKNPNTVIFPGKKNLRFEKVNMVNVKKDASWTLDGCNNAQVSFCSHLHPEMGLDPCAVDCEHRVDDQLHW